MKEEKLTKNPVGRPPILADGKGGKRRGIYLDDETWRKAIVLGDGKPSEGIRRAVKKCLTQKRK